MRRVLPILFSMLVLSLVAPAGVLADTAPELVAVSSEAIDAEPTIPVLDLSLDGADGAIFLDTVDDAAYNACCQGNLTICIASCVADVRSFSCTRVGARGCSSSCSC